MPTPSRDAVGVCECCKESGRPLRYVVAAFAVLCDPCQSGVTPGFIEAKKREFDARKAKGHMSNVAARERVEQERTQFVPGSPLYFGPRFSPLTQTGHPVART